MPKFMLAYHGGKIPESKEEGARVMAAWEAWFAELGSDLVDPGAPVGRSQTVSRAGVTDDGGANPISGYTIVTAADYPAAIALAKGCPLLAAGTVEVAQIVQM